jgi:hypothetical protein
MKRFDDAVPVVHRSIQRLDARFVMATIALVLAVVTIALDLPMALRAPALLAMLVMPGFALTSLLLGDSNDHGDQAVRIPLSILLGVLTWLAVSLLLDAFGIPLGKSLAIGVGAVGLTLATLVTLLRLRRTPAIRSNPQAVAARATAAMKSSALITVGVVVLGAATVVAASMITRPVERYTTLAFVDNKPFAGELPVVVRGEAIRFNWVLRGFGCTPSPVLTRVRLAVDGNAIDDIAVDTSASSAGTLTGAVTFTVPATVGRHLVVLAVLPADDGGVPLPEPGFVSTFLEVRT